MKRFIASVVLVILASLLILVPTYMFFENLSSLAENFPQIRIQSFIMQGFKIFTTLVVILCLLLAVEFNTKPYA